MKPVEQIHLEEQVNAEMFLSYCHPEISDGWTVRNKGVFYRNYSPDVIFIDYDNREVEFSRDGFLNMLPSHLISAEDDLRSVDPKGRRRKKSIAELNKELVERVKILSDVFMPLDTLLFGLNMKLERKLEDLLFERMKIVLEMFCSFDVDGNHDENLDKAACFLPFINNTRGDFHFVRNLLQLVTGCRVKMSFSSYGKSDNNVCSLPEVRYSITVNDLDSSSYKELALSLKPFLEHVAERYIPFDCFSEFRISGVSDNGSLLDYNILLN